MSHQCNYGPYSEAYWAREEELRKEPPKKCVMCDSPNCTGVRFDDGVWLLCPKCLMRLEELESIEARRVSWLDYYPPSGRMRTVPGGSGSGAWRTRWQPEIIFDAVPE